MSTENKVPENVIARAAEFKKHMTHDGEGIINVDQKSLQSVIDANLPEGMSSSMAKDFKAEEKITLAALGYATGEIAVDVFAKDKDVKSVSSAAKWFGDKMAASMDRSREITIPGRNGAPVTKETRQNYLVVKHKTQSVSPSGALSKVKAHFANLAK
tara:strand:- start:118 stop:588 length:471 start_codon:yes stop_codon:yes gene_type:complete